MSIPPELRRIGAREKEKTDRLASSYTHGALEFARRLKPCDHDWQSTENWLIDRCSKCGEERA